MKQFKHGGGYKLAAINEGLNWHEVTDYSTSINWIAPDYFPDDLIFLHQENIEYPDAAYHELKDVINNTYHLSSMDFILTHGANEAISALFYFFNIKETNKSKEIAFVGPTYCEYHKYAFLTGFYSKQYDLEHLSTQIDKLKGNIVIIVNPNTPSGIYYNIEDDIVTLLKSGSIVIIDESFIDFTPYNSIRELINTYNNLYIVYSLTKFFGSPGARLGLLIGKNISKTEFSGIIPPWNISRYEDWFYRKMIPKHKQIKFATLDWIKSINNSLEVVSGGLKNIKQLNRSITSFHVLEIKTDYMKQNGIIDLQKHFLKKYNIYIRPVGDFYGYNNNNFRAGLRLPEDNTPLLKALEDVG